MALGLMLRAVTWLRIGIYHRYYLSHALFRVQVSGIEVALWSHARQRLRPGRKTKVVRSPKGDETIHLAALASSYLTFPECRPPDGSLLVSDPPEQVHGREEG
jgi:hypothetical protein